MIRRAVTGPTSSCSRSTRNQARSSPGLVTIRAAATKSLTWAASVNRSPPYFTNGMPRAASSISSTSLWCAARTRTAWSRRSVPASWASRTRAQISRACVASSWQRTSTGAAPAASLAAVSASSSPEDCGRTALASRSTGCLDR